MTREQLAVRYMRGWIGLAEYRAELVTLYDREDALERANENHDAEALKPAHERSERRLMVLRMRLRQAERAVQ